MHIAENHVREAIFTGTAWYSNNNQSLLRSAKTTSEMGRHVTDMRECLRVILAESIAKRTWRPGHGRRDGSACILPKVYYRSLSVIDRIRPHSGDGRSSGSAVGANRVVVLPRLLSTSSANDLGSDNRAHTRHANQYMSALMGSQSSAGSACD